MDEERRSKWLKRLIGFGIQRDDAEELLQTALVKACDYLRRQHPNLDSEGIESLLTDALLARILKCCMSDFFEAINREFRFLQEYLAVCELQSPDEHDWWTLQAADEVLNHLPECWRIVAQLRVQGHKWQEIATQTGMPIGTLASGLERAIEVACKDLGYLQER